MKAPNLLTIEVAYATPNKQKIITVQVPQGTSIFDAISQSKIQQEFIELVDIDFNDNLKVGIFGKKIDSSKYQLQNQDRIEIYRKLAKTPNERRLERAKCQNTS